jgi:hypothetical protein
MIWARHVALMGGNILVTKPEGEIPPRRSMHKCEIMVEWILGEQGGKI